MSDSPTPAPRDAAAPDAPVDTSHTTDDSAAGSDSPPDPDAEPTSSSPGDPATAIAAGRQRALGWLGCLIAGGGPAVTEPLGLIGAAGLVAFFGLAPSGIGQLLAFAFGQVAAAVLLPIGSNVFVIVELALFALLGSTVPLSGDRPSRLSLGIGVGTLGLAVGGVWIAVTSGLGLLVVALGVGLGGAVLLYRVQRYERTAIMGPGR